jgi:hypothetical protein
VIAAYIEHYHDRPHSRLDYRTPREVRATWAMHKEHYKHCGLNRQHQRERSTSAWRGEAIARKTLACVNGIFWSTHSSFISTPTPVPYEGAAC